SRHALDVAERNAERHGVWARVAFRETDLPDAIAGPFDAIVANPPYVLDRAAAALQPEVRDHEPAVALFGGADGLSLVTRLAADAPRRLRSGGYLMFEFGLGPDVEIQDLLAAAAHLDPGAPWHGPRGVGRPPAARTRTH